MWFYITSLNVFAFHFVFKGAKISISFFVSKWLTCRKNLSQSLFLQNAWLLSWQKLLRANRAKVKHEDVLCTEGGRLQSCRFQ